MQQLPFDRRLQNSSPLMVLRTRVRVTTVAQLLIFFLLRFSDKGERESSTRKV